MKGGSKNKGRNNDAEQGPGRLGVKERKRECGFEREYIQLQSVTKVGKWVEDTTVDSRRYGEDHRLTD